MATFDDDSAKRIAQTVRYVESLQRNKFVPGDGAPRLVPPGFHARISGTDGNGKYSWKMQKISSGTYIDDVDGLSGTYSDETGYAQEALWGSKDVLPSAIVWMEPGYLEDIFVFAYTPGMCKATATEDVDGGTWASPGTGSASVPGGSITMYNPFTAQIADETTVGCGYIEGHWYAIAEDCGG